MERHIEDHTAPHAPPQRNNIIGGSMLIGIGLLLLFSNWFDFGILVLPGLGGIFLLWGVLMRTSPLLIPGGILSGIGLGVFVMEGPLRFVDDERKGGVFLLAFALGWFIIPVLSKLFTRDRHWWAFIPGSIMALIGAAVLGGGIWISLLSLVGSYWPLGLIVVGLFLLLRRGQE